MNISRLLIVAYFFSGALVSQAQKTISEGTITYDIVIQPKKTGTKTSSGLNGSKSTIYLKGMLSRTEISSSFGTETTIFDAKTGNAAILKEYSGQKLMITLTKDNWEARNKKYDGIVFENAPETKVIEGYKCKRAFSKLKDGSSISVYYSPDLVLINKEYNSAFKNLPGFPMEYEFETEKNIFRYQLSNIDFGSLPTAKFDFPKSGYRIMTYEQNREGKIE